MGHIQGIFCVELSGPATALSVSVTCRCCVILYHNTLSVSVTCRHMQVLRHSVSQYIIQLLYIFFPLFSSHSNGCSSFCSHLRIS